MRNVALDICNYKVYNNFFVVFLLLNKSLAKHFAINHDRNSIFYILNLYYNKKLHKKTIKGMSKWPKQNTLYISFKHLVI